MKRSLRYTSRIGALVAALVISGASVAALLGPAAVVPAQALLITIATSAADRWEQNGVRTSFIGVEPRSSLG